jgi:TetR/AcrR family transcriptional regulator, cholesterol catabolism regulator
MPKGIPITEEEQIQRRKQICVTAAQLFSDKGFNETSMHEIAEAIGAGKSTLYDYFKTKDDILIAYFEDILVGMNAKVEEIIMEDIPAREKLRKVMQFNLDLLLSNRNFYMRMSIEAQRVGIESQQRMAASRHAYQDMICKLVKEGILEGSFRPVDPIFTMRVILASLTPAVFTTRPSGTPQEMMDKAFDLILNGIKA